MRTLLTTALLLSLAGFAGCGSGGASENDGRGSGGAGSGGGSGGGAVAGASPGSGGSASGTAQLRFLYQVEWKDHLGNCPGISDYRIKFGANPVPVTVSIEAMAGWLSPYATVDGRTYEDADVLHVFSCNKSQTSKQTLQLYGRFGTDLGLEPSKRYTVTLGGTMASLAEDP